MKLLLILIITFLTFARGEQVPEAKYVFVDDLKENLDLSYNRNSQINFAVHGDAVGDYKISYVENYNNSPNIETIVLNKDNQNAVVKFSSSGKYKIKNTVNDKIIQLTIDNLYNVEKNHKENDVNGKEFIEQETFAEYNNLAKKIDQQGNSKKASSDKISNAQADVGAVTQQQQQQSQQTQQTQPKDNVVNAKPSSDAKQNTNAKPSSDAKQSAANTKPKTDAAAPKTDATAPKTDATAPKADATAPKTDETDNGNNSNIISVSIKMIAIVAVSLLVFF